METFGHFLLGSIGIIMFLLIIYSCYKAQYVVNTSHALIFAISVGCILFSFIPVSKLSIGAAGISAEVSQKKTVDILNAILEAQGSQEQKLIIAGLLSRSNKEDEWISVPLDNKMPDAVGDASIPSNSPIPESKKTISAKKSSKKVSKTTKHVDIPGPVSKAAKEPEMPTKPPDVISSNKIVNDLVKRGLVDAKVQQGKLMIKPKSQEQSNGQKTD